MRSIETCCFKSATCAKLKSGNYVCFVDYTKAFDITHKQLTECLKEIDGRGVRLISNMY